MGSSPSRHVGDSAVSGLQTPPAISHLGNWGRPREAGGAQSPVHSLTSPPEKAGIPPEAAQPESGTHTPARLGPART